VKIIVISTTVLPCPPPGYAGLEMIAYQQAHGLARRGHDVLLVAPKGSVPPPGVELHETTLGESEQAAYSGYWQKLPAADAIIDNSWQKWSYILKVEGKLGAPILGVMHAPAHTMYSQAPPVLFPCLVAISKDQSVGILEALGVPSRVAYNGIDLDFYKPREGVRRSERYLFLGRFSTVKGPQIAVDLARRLRFELDLVGDDTITGEPQLAQRIRMAAVNNIKFHGPSTRERTVDWYSGAKALLHMNQVFREPFGLAPVEAQACGLPVIAFDNGAMRETIIHGETGFVVKSVDEVEELIKTNAVAKISPEACRKNAERFSVKHMIDSYESLCKEAIEGGGW